MKPAKYLNLIIALIVIATTGFKSLEDPIEKLKASLTAYNAMYPCDKVYLQFDKPFYKPGEDIWFNAFVLNGNTHLPSTASDVLYVELLDPRGNTFSKLELFVKDGTTHGDFGLPETIAGGIFKIRAYTQWMMNDSQDVFFKKDLQVQAVITPQLLLKLDFEKESYGPGDNVTCKLTASNLKNEKAAGANVRAMVSLAGQKLTEVEYTTDSKGLANIEFKLPEIVNSADGLLQVIVTSRGVEESISRSIPIVLNKIKVNFFAEGGHSLENFQGSMAFKAVNEFGKGADVSGSIVDEANQVVTTFESFHMGMGAFEFTPLHGKKYFARIDRPLGNKNLTPIPDALANGFAMNLGERGKSHLSWAINSTTSTSGYLVGQSHGTIISSTLISLNKGINKIVVSLEKFPMGIAVFTLFDNQGVEQCERLAFVNPAKGLHVRLTTNKERYLPREKVTVNVETTDDQGKPVPSKLSLSVVDDKLISFADDKQDNILSSMFLSSEVRGEIQEPSFYFDPEEEKAPQALDYLLMTQGWRRFTWKEVREPVKQILYAPEKIRTITGYVVDSDRKGISGEVSLIELNGKHRIIKVTSTEDGFFLFRNIDPTTSIMLLTRKPGQITLRKDLTFSVSLQDDGVKKNKDQIVGVREEIRSSQDETAEADDDGIVTIESELDMNMDTDVTSLEEVVIIGYGSERKRDMTGALSTVHAYQLESFAPTGSLEQALQGRVAGIFVQPQNANAGAQANINMRGYSSFSTGRSEPIFIVDGHPIESSLNQNFSNGSLISPDDIESISVLHSPEATAIYGSRGVNGVIIVTTRSRIGYTMFQQKKKPARYSSLTITPRKFSTTRDFYSEAPSKTKNDSREDFRSTLYWNHTVITDGKGKAEISFYNNDAVTAFRITSEGVSNSGMIGRSEQVYYTQLPYSLSTRIPEFLGLEDVMKLPVVVKNETSDALSGSIKLNLPFELSSKESPEINVQVPANTSQTYYYTISPKGITGTFPVAISLDAGGSEDELKQNITVQPVGFPVKESFSSKDPDKTISFDITDAEKGSLNAKFTAYPDALSDLLAGAESIFQEPYGCFEQVSASTFPNILALQFLKQSDLKNPATEKIALRYIKSGYDKLAAYEIRGGGFEWFGHPKAHEGLTAYGLLEFHEMQKVFNDVDSRMVKRTKDWLLSRRNRTGGFLQNKGKYGFSSASETVNNAYIVYALTETGVKDIELEYGKAFDEAIKSKDMYRMALMANASFNMNKMDNYARLIKLFEDLTPNGFSGLGADHSVVRSYGKSLEIEVVSLWALAIIKSRSADFAAIRRCINHIVASRAHGGFGSTQATVLALKALTEYYASTRMTRGDGEIQLLVGNTLADKAQYLKDANEKIEMTDFSKYITNNGKQSVRVLFKDNNSLPYTIDLSWYSKKPQSDERCKVSISTALASSAVKMNETVRLVATLTNKTSEGLPMTMAIVGIPAGLSAQPWQLKELTEKKAFDFYEITDGKLVLYYTEMAPNEVRKINLDLKAEVPGSYTGAASSAYLYYTNEYKYWTKGNSVVIN